MQGSSPLRGSFSSDLDFFQLSPADLAPSRFGGGAALKASFSQPGWLGPGREVFALI